MRFDTLHKQLLNTLRLHKTLKKKHLMQFEPKMNLRLIIYFIVVWILEGDTIFLLA
jgi:hypothetical protein